MFAVISSRTWRVAAGATVTVTVLLPAGLKVYPAEPTRVLNVDPLVLPCTVSVWVRAPQPAGSLSTSRSTVIVAPRSTWIHCGKALFGLSQ